MEPLSLSGDGTTQADAIDFTGGVNSLTLEAGFSIIGNVVAFSAADTLILGGSSNSNLRSNRDLKKDEALSGCSGRFSIHRLRNFKDRQPRERAAVGALASQ